MTDLKRSVRAWAKQIGKQTAVARLVTRGVSPRAAEKLCDGVYPSEPKALRPVLVDELSKDGFSPAVTGGKAS